MIKFSDCGWNGRHAMLKIRGPRVPGNSILPRRIKIWASGVIGQDNVPSSYEERASVAQTRFPRACPEAVAEGSAALVIQVLEFSKSTVTKT